MTKQAPLLIADFNYPLPDERIAKYPLPERDHSKLLVYRDGQVSEDRFYNVGDYIAPGSLLIYNNTRVIPARMVFHKQHVSRGEDAQPVQGARIEIFCLEPIWPKEYQLALSRAESCRWKCMVGNARKWHDEELAVTLRRKNGKEVTLYAKKGEAQGNAYTVYFRWDDKEMSFAEVLDAVGQLPIPPYLNRETEESDKTTYQTVYSRIKGSVAAPTAGLHFTDRVLDDLRRRGIQTEELTLHVGAGTFLPVKTEDANEHPMHAEIISVPIETIQRIMDNLGHIVAVGTTSMRTLESLYYIGVHLQHFSFSDFPFEECRFEDYPWSTTDFKELQVEQFEPYKDLKDELSTREALQQIIRWLQITNQTELHARTRIMIKPGFRFRVVDQLITNFHQPQSTLLLLVSAFVDGDWKTIYDYALSHDFRFLSYGDSSILTRRK